MSDPYPPTGFREIRDRGTHCWLREDLPPEALDQLWQEGDPFPGARGRGGVRRMSLPGGLEAVVRPYRRGGLLGSLLGERYPAKLRVFDEVAALAALAASDVPVVQPLAGLARKAGGFWRLRLVTEWVPGALPLTDWVMAHPQYRGAAVRQAGVLVQRSLRAGLEHPDLHPDNLLVAVGEFSRSGERVDGGGGGAGGDADPRQGAPESPKPLLIDLDRAQVHRQPVGPEARDRMLLRFARYTFRHSGRLGTPRLRDRSRFLQGMGMDRSARRAELIRLGSPLRQAVERRGLKWE